MLFFLFKRIWGLNISILKQCSVQEKYPAEKNLVQLQGHNKKSKHNKFNVLIFMNKEEETNLFFTSRNIPNMSNWKSTIQTNHRATPTLYLRT